MQGKLPAIVSTIMLLCLGAVADDMKEMLARGRLVVSMMSTELPPFIMTGANGEPEGYDVDIARGVAAELGLVLVIERKAKTFNEMVDAVADGRADMALSKLSRTLNRSKSVLFSNPYLVLHKSLLINRLEMAKRRGNTALADYIKKLDSSIGIIKGSSYVEYARTMFPKAKIREFQDWETILAEVDSGRVLCAFRDDLEIKRSMRSMPGASLRLLSVIMVDSEDAIAIAVGAKQNQFHEWLDEYLDERKVHTTADKLLEKYPSASLYLSAQTATAAPPPGDKRK
jgi:polar amino acid transport system substrate-binding protein